MSVRISRRDFLKLGYSLPVAGLSASRLAKVFAPLEASPSQPNILMIVFDTLSARHMSLYGYPRKTTPNLERLAERAVVYHAHHATGNFTSPTTASMFTGVYPWAHRAIHLHSTMLPEFSKLNFFSHAHPAYTRLGYSHNHLVTSLLYQMRAHLEEYMPTRALALLDTQMADRLFDHDFNMAFWSESVLFRRWISKSSSLFFAPIYRILEALGERRLESDYGELFPLGIPYDNGLYYLLETGMEFCIQDLWQLPQPFLAYFHFLPPHAPYTPRREFVDLFDDGYISVPKPRHRFSESGVTKRFLREKRQRYDEFLAYADSEFGRLYDFLESSGKLDNTVLIFTSDHGEMFERNIWGHSTRTLYEPLIHVPLLIKMPGQRERLDVSIPTSQVDLLSTLMHIMRRPLPEWGEGVLMPPFGETPAERTLYAMVNKRNSFAGALQKGSFALIRYPYKLIHYRNYGDYPNDKDELYNLADDPEELNNLVKSQKELWRELRQALEDKLGEVNQAYKQ